MRKLGWVVVAGSCMLYAPFAIEYMWRFFAPGSPELWTHVLAWVTSDQHAYGPGSVRVEQQAAYTATRWLLLAHTAAGGLAILASVALFLRWIRERGALHRQVASVQIGLVLVSMTGAFGYLAVTGPGETFNGPPFFWQLVLLGLATLGSTVLCVVALRRGDDGLYQAALAYNLGMLMAAPVLRVWWLVLGAALPSATQEVTNVPSAVAVPVLLVVGAIIASRTLDSRTEVPDALRPLPGRRLEVAVYTSAVVALGWLALRYLSLISQVGVVLVTVSGIVAGWWIAFAVAGALARRRERPAAAEEWRAHTAALAATPALFAVMWAVFDLLHTAEEAFDAAAFGAPAVAMSAGYLLVALRRRAVPATRAGDTAAVAAAAVVA